MKMQKQNFILISECAHRNPSTREKEVEMAVRKWLSGASDRNGGRKREPTTPQQSPSTAKVQLMMG